VTHLTRTERALAEIVVDLRADLVRIMVEGDDHARAMARGADRRAALALEKIPERVRWQVGNSSAR